MKCAFPTFFASYGSLRRRSLSRQGNAVVRGLQFHGNGLLRGLGFLQRGYPGVIEQPGVVEVEIYRVLDEEVWEKLDRYEGYIPNLGERSLFYRKNVRLLHPEICASVYFLGREIPRGRQRRPREETSSRESWKSEYASASARIRNDFAFRSHRKSSIRAEISPFRAP